MFNYKKFSLPKIFTIFFSYSTSKTESPCANSRYSQCLNCFSYLLPAVDVFRRSKIIRDGPTDGRTYGNSPLCPTGHRPFGAAAQKGRLVALSLGCVTE